MVVIVCSASQVHLSLFQGHYSAQVVVQEHTPVPLVQHFAIFAPTVPFLMLLVHLKVKIALIAPYTQHRAVGRSSDRIVHALVDMVSAKINVLHVSQESTSQILEIPDVRTALLERFRQQMH